MKNLNIIFSIPINEKFEVVVDQILNFKTLNNNCGIIIHISQGFNYEQSELNLDCFLEIVNKIDNVYINDKKLRTGKYDIIQAHLSNFEYVKNIIDFDYFCMCASNELFFKEGLYDYIKKYDAGVGYNNIKFNPKWIPGKYAKNDDSLKKIMKILDVKNNNIIGSQIEGSFYKKKIFEKICLLINENYDFNNMKVAYAREEVYFSTIVWNLSLLEKKLKIKENGMVTYCPWNRKYTMNVKINEIDNLLLNENNFFSVKRVPRIQNDCVRQYLRQMYNYAFMENRLLSTNYVYEKKIFLKMKEIKKIIKCNCEVFIKVLKKLKGGTK